MSINDADYSSLQQLDKRSSGVSATVYTSDKNDKISNDIKRHNLQYPSIDLKFYLKVHDRFQIIGGTIYLIGASLKDLGKKLFGFTKMESITAEELLSPEPAPRRAIVTLHARWRAGTALYYIAPPIVTELLRFFLVLSANSELT